MHILAFNCGSSSVKCAVVDSETGARSFELRTDDLRGPARRLIVGCEGTRAGDLEANAAGVRPGDLAELVVN